MKKKKALQIVFVCIVALIVAVSMMVVYFSCNKDADETTMIKQKNDYKAAYLEYIKNNDYFNRGMMLCDLNDDGVPELFSITYTEEGDLITYHKFNEDSGTVTEKSSVKTYIDVSELIKSSTFYENPLNFIGIYKNKSSGCKALINSVSNGNWDDRFDIIFFDRELKIKNEGVKAPAENSFQLATKRDIVMNEYELSDDALYSRFLVRGEYGGKYGEDPAVALSELIEEYESKKNKVVFEEAENGEMFCYVRNISLSDNEIELIPVAYISLEKYQKSMDSDKLVNINGEAMSIQYDEVVLGGCGIANLVQSPYFKYEFDVPTEQHPVSVIEGYRGNTPVKIKMSPNLKIRYGVLGEYNANGTPVGYETLGRSRDYAVSEYIPYFARYCMGSYYKAFIEDGELIFLDVLYDE